MALLGGVVGFGVAQKAAAQQPSTLSNMPYASTPLSGAELAYVVQGGVSKKTPVSSIAAPGGASGQLQYNDGGAFGGYGIGSGLSVVGGSLTATGGGSGGFITSIATLQGLSPATGSAILTLGGRTGLFTWNGANLSAQVTGDPGQGITIAPASDTTGASGAWVRQYPLPDVYLSWWGVLADGTTDNSTALINWNTWARTQAGVTAHAPTGQINFDMFHCFGTLFGLLKLNLYGYGTTFQNVSTTSGYQWPFFFACAPNLHSSGPLIATTTVGATSVTCLTPAQASAFVVGNAAVVMSLDLEYVGYPPACDQFDFVIVTGVNASTGVVTFANDTIRYIHRADFPDGGNSTPCGKARIWPLDSTSGGLSIPWNVEHVYHGLKIPEDNQSGAGTYTQQVGRSIKSIDCTYPGISPSICGYAGFERCKFTAQCETDKLVDILEFKDCRAYNILNNVQTSSVNLVRATNCNFQELQAGNAKLTIIDNCNIEAFNDGGYQFGCPRTVVIINSRIQSYPEPPMLANLTDYNLTVDGVNSIFANGVFTILNAGTFPNSSVLWNTIVGNEIVLGQSSVGHPGNKGVGYVTAIADVGSGASAALQITTTLPYANLAAASWASGGVLIKRRGRVFVYGSSGCDVINNLNDGTFLKYLPGEYWRALIFGVTATTMNPPYIGELIELDVNVIQATAISGAALIFTSFNALTIPALTGGVTYTITIDLTTVGQRTFTLAGLLGKQPNDSVVLNSVTQNALPAVWCPITSPLGMRINYTPSSSSPYLLPVAEVIMKLSTGITGKLVPLLETAGVTGQIP